MPDPKPKKPAKKKLIRETLIVPVPVLTASRWNFHELTNLEKGIISEWIERSHWAVKTRANFDRALDQLKLLPIQRWSKPNPASNIGDHTYVIRFQDVTSKQLRVFGHFFDAHHAFTMTLEGYEKGNVYYPKKYKDLAKDNRESCDKEFEGRTIPFEDRCAICAECHNFG